MGRLSWTRSLRQLVVYRCTVKSWKLKDLLLQGKKTIFFCPTFPRQLQTEPVPQHSQCCKQILKTLPKQATSCGRALAERCIWRLSIRAFFGKGFPKIYRLGRPVGAIPMGTNIELCNCSESRIPDCLQWTLLPMSRFSDLFCSFQKKLSTTA